jgi:endonuclease/exonuclease/phosphatase family metal-dependent hydrolase
MFCNTPRHRATLVPLFLIALSALHGCSGHHALVRRQTAEPGGPSWFGPSIAAEQTRLSRWASGVGPPVVVSRTTAVPPTDSLVLVSWNVSLGSGNLESLIGDVRSANPESALVLLLQEAYREGPEVPTAIPAGTVFPSRLGGDLAGDDVEAVAEKCGLNLYYVPSMRNGSPFATDEDRGNAILSTLPLDELTAIELPFESQRRVAVAATTVGRSTHGSPWRIRVVSAHLDNMVGARRLWLLGSTFARARQAKALVEHVRDQKTAVLGGDFNTWLGFADPTFTGTQASFPDTHLADRRPTFRNILRLDHVFFRLPDGWRATLTRAEHSYGSDHWPLIATIRLI